MLNNIYLDHDTPGKKRHTFDESDTPSSGSLKLYQITSLVFYQDAIFDTTVNGITVSESPCIKAFPASARLPRQTM